jgi:hypothetical protein
MSSSLVFRRQRLPGASVPCLVAGRVAPVGTVAKQVASASLLERSRDGCQRVLVETVRGDGCLGSSAQSSEQLAGGLVHEFISAITRTIVCGFARKCITDNGRPRVVVAR